MCEPVTAFMAANAGMIMAASAGVSMLGAMQQSKAQKTAAEYNSAIAANNAKVSEWQAQDAQDRALRNAEDLGRRQAAVKGEQKAKMAANGLDLSMGTPEAVLDQTDFYGLQDQANAVDAGNKEAWALRTKRDSFTAESGWQRSKAAAESPAMAGATSLISSAGNVASRWARPGAGGTGMGNPNGWGWSS
jgi:hypothetical protein